MAERNRQSSATDPFSLLQDIAQRSRQKAAGLPAQIKIQAHDSGVGFRLGAAHYFCPMGEVAEILPVPAYTQLPGVAGWVKGVANVRGRLLPIFDLGAYLGEPVSAPRKLRRIVVVDFGQVFAGLIVDEVLGMQHFEQAHFQKLVPSESPERIRPYLAGSYNTADGLWPVFSLFALASHPQFMQVAV